MRAFDVHHVRSPLIRGAKKLRVAIVADNCSLNMGGEAAIPFHYFNFLRQRGIDACLVGHARNGRELRQAFPNDHDRLLLSRDDKFHHLMHQLGSLLPNRMNRASFRFLSMLHTQVLQRKILRQLIRDKGINVVHQPMPVSPAEPSFICDVGAPVVIGPMNGGMSYPPGFRDRENGFERLAVEIGRNFGDIANRVFAGKRQAAALLVANQRTRKSLPNTVASRIIEIPENGVDLNIWQARDPAKRNGSSVVRFVYMGRLIDWKGVDLLLEAWSKLPRTLNAKLEIIGDGPLRPQLEKMCRTLGISEFVNFTGWLSQPQANQRLAESDALVLPSLIECGAAVVLEAMAVGLPVIATEWGGPTDYVNVSTGILVPPTSHNEFVAGLATAMMELYESPERRRRMGEAGRRRVVELFNWEHKVDQILTIYQQAAEGAFDQPPQRVVAQRRAPAPCPAGSVA